MKYTPKKENDNMLKGYVGGSGIILNFTEDHTETLMNGGTIKGRFRDYLKAKVTVHIVAEGSLDDDPDTFQCEPGFKIDTKPRHCPPDKKRAYEVWLTKDNARKLVKDGKWESRSRIDRVYMSYYDFSK